MQLSKKCQYALRAVFDLAIRNNAEPVKVHQIAESQHIPPRFLEIILNQLRHGGFVESRRGNEGGYLLSRPAEAVTVGEIIEFVHGPLEPLSNHGDKDANGQVVRGDYAFGQLWRKTGQAVKGIYDKTTIKDLVDREMRHSQASVTSYAI